MNIAPFPIARRSPPLARLLFAATLLMPAALLPAAAPRPALAQTTGALKITKVTVSGNHQVPTADIERAMTLHPGETATRADLQANLNAIVSVYRRTNVGASFKQRMTTRSDGRTVVAYSIHEEPPAAPAPAAVLRVDRVTFEGNHAVSSDAIRSALTLHPGQPVNDADMTANTQALMQLYRKKNVGVSITPRVSYPAPNHAAIDYAINEKP